MTRLLFVTLSNIGDLVMTTPTLVALHEAFSGAKIDIVADRRSSDLLVHCPFLGDLFHRDKPAGNRGLLALIAALRARRYEAIVDLRTDFLPWVLHANLRSLRWLARPAGEHAVEQHFAVGARLLSGSPGIPAPSVWTNAESRARAQAQLQRVPGRRLVIAPGANWAGKCWPIAHYITLVNLLAADFDALVVLGSAGDRAAAAALQASAPLPSIDLAGQTSLVQAVALLEQCHAFVGNDSGLGHIAAACRVPTLTVFGPGRPARYRPWGARAAIVCAPGADLAALAPAEVAMSLRAHLGGLAAGLD
ncbi:MAG: glycosyltransferase family 9 protein [Gammaproteobacteria bacterium]|nr:glycosyltransferase family 9 protein [Gammaproteobacteria bacterium]